MTLVSRLGPRKPADKARARACSLCGDREVAPGNTHLCEPCSTSPASVDPDADTVPIDVGDVDFVIVR